MTRPRTPPPTAAVADAFLPDLSTPAARRARLEALTAQARRVILARQDAHTGLLPASTAVTVHGDYTHAWVRDNVYSILAVWALAQAWREVDVAEAAALDAPVVRLMRGLLAAMMRQAHKVERFKHTQHPLDALHAKYGTRDGEPVVGDADWGHLQIDATAIYVLMLAQMSAAGLPLVHDEAEQAFVQNLVYYLGKAWRTPDYGIWERGHKRNEGVVEINASSVGMAKAALEAIDGLALRGPGAPRIHVPADDIAQARQVLEALLPRESESKETDGALLAITGFPAHAVDDAALATRTREGVREKLEGRYGAKRFLRDGHQTVLEDHARLHYEPGELARFEHIECEWPLFFTYALIDAALRGEAAQADDYRARLEALMVEREGERLLPELYVVPAEAVQAERAAPRSQARVPNANLPLVWAQSLYLVGVLLHEGLLAPPQLDPLGRRRAGAPALDLQGAGQAPRQAPRQATLQATAQATVQVAVLAGDALVRARLAAHGIASETPEALQRDGDITIAHAEDVEPLWRQLGRHDGLGLGGRPAEPLGPLATAEVLAAPGRRLVVAPALFNRQGSYLALDNRLLVGDIEAELAYLARHARGPGQPLFTLWVTAPMLDAPGAEGLIDFLRRLAVPGGGEASAHAGPLDAESPAAMGPDASPPDPVPPGAGSPTASSPAVVPSRSADRPVLPVRVGPLATLIGQATTRSLDWLAELPAPLRPAPPPAGAAATAPVPALLAPWDEAATHPLSAARRAGIEASPDAPALWARLAHSANPFEQVAVLGRLATLAGLEARPAPLPDGAPGTAPEGASCTAPEGASCTAPEGATSKSPAGATSPSPDLPSAAPPAAASVRQRLQALHDRAAARRHWGLLRRAAAVLDAPDDLLEDGVARLMAQQKRLRLGAPGSPRAVVARALGQGELQAWLHEGTGADAQGRVLVQELVLLLGTLVKAEPALFDGVLTLRPAELLQRLVARAAKEHDLPQAAAFEHLLALSPQALRARLRDLLAATCSPAGPRVLGPAAVPRRAGRQTAGTVARLGGDFPVRLWQLLRRVGGLEIGAAHDGQHRLDPALAQAEMTAGERGFALHLEACLDRIASPAWRQLSIEALQALAALPADDAAFAGAPTLVIDELLEEAARRCQAPADVNPGDEVPAEQAPTAGERPEAVPSEDAAPEDAVPARAPPAPLDATAVLLSVDPAILAAHVSAAARQRAQAALPQAPEGQEGLGAPSTSAVEAST